MSKTNTNLSYELSPSGSPSIAKVDVMLAKI